MNNTPKHTCKDCMYYEIVTSESECRRYPPSYNNRPNYFGTQIYYPHFPIVTPSTWCGEFKMRNKIKGI